MKFLKSKEGSAMVQMGDPGAMERAKANLTGSYFFDGKLQSGYVGCSAFQIRFNE